MGISFILCAFKTDSEEYIHCYYCDLQYAACRFQFEGHGDVCGSEAGLTTVERNNVLIAYPHY